MSMSRREIGGTVLGLAAAAGLSDIQIPAKVDAAHVRYFAAAVDRLYVQDSSVGSGSLVRDGLRLYSRARRILEEADFTDEIARGLMSAAGEIAVCVGWLCTDADDQRTAHMLYSEAQLLASQAGDNQLAVHAMQQMAMPLVRQSRELQRPGYARQAVTLAKRAAELARAEPCPQLHALLASTEATALSVVGNSEGFKLAIARAWREMDSGYTGEVPAWLRFVNRSEVAYHEARGYWRLGDMRTATEQLYRMTLQPDPSPRNEAAGRATLAEVLATSGDCVNACAEGSAVLTALETGKIRSARTIKRLSTVRRLAAQHASGAEFREQYDRIVRGDNSA